MSKHFPQDLRKQLETELRKEGYHNIPNQTREFKGYNVTFAFNTTSGVTVNSFEKLEDSEAKSNTEPETTLLDKVLAEKLASGEVKKSGVAWYEYQGKKYNGKTAIKKALIPKD